MSSEKRTQANRRNAQKSTGPRTPEGKAASSRNALKHGFAAQMIAVIPGEDAADYNAELQSWIDRCDGDPAQIALAERGCRTSWQLRRLARADDARIATQARSAADLFELAQLTRAQKLGERLYHDPQNRCVDQKTTPDWEKKYEEWRAIDPRVITAELETFAQGVDWMIERWRLLSIMLDEEEFWHYDSRYQATKLIGKRPEDVLRDPQISDIMLACLAIHPAPWDPMDEVYQATTGTVGRSNYFYRVKLLERCKPETPEQAMNYLKKMVNDEVIRLYALKADHLDARAAADKADAPLRVLFDAGPDAPLRLRYEAHLDRTLRGAVSELGKLRKAAATAPEARPARPRREPVAATEVTIGKAVEEEAEASPPGPERP